MTKKISSIINFIKDLVGSRKMIMQLAKNDFKVKYTGSYLGIAWSFIQPMITIFIFWFVFQVGFRTAPVGDYPYILWMICGLVPWYFISDGINFSTTCFMEYSYLVKKVVFRISILPIVKIISALFIHIFFVSFIFFMFFIYGYGFNIYNIQVIYYVLASTILVCGISWITSSLNVFVKDISQLVNIILQFAFWLTPIFWSYKMIPEKYLILFKINPVYYIIEGYRDTFINNVWFWSKMEYTIYFWIINITIFILGITLFKKLKPHFADLL